MSWVRPAAALLLALGTTADRAHAQDAFAPVDALNSRGLVQPAVAADATLSAESWLLRMQHALASTAFSGTLVYLRDGQLDALRISHQPGAAGAVGDTTLESLSGEIIGVTTQRGAVRLASHGAVSVWPDAAGALAVTSLQPPPAAHYELALAGPDRVAGRQAQVIELRPRDGFRYGYRLWLDTGSALLLKSLTVGSDGRAVEQLMFTALDVPLPPVSGRDEAQAAPTTEAPAAVASESANESSLWQVLDAPDGFTARVIAGGDMTHLLFSDGVARISVYVEPLVAQTPTLSGPLSKGALNAYGRVAHGRQIVAMGNAPAATIERFAQGVVAVDSPARPQP